MLGRYQLLMPIAKGGMGQVWAARQSGTRGFQKMVAVKTILPSHEDGQHLEAMLFEEASLASLVRHPNVAETLDLGEREDGTLYLVMEWVDGEPLDFILRAARSVGGIPLAIAAHLIIQACKGLHAAHVACNSKGEPLGIVHRDISPQNLLVTYSGVVKLIDFGVAKATQQMSPPTAVGQVKGKFAYMSPEQVHGEKLDARADVFAMGIVLYRVTTGTHPFKSDNPAATLRNILASGPARPSELVPQYPSALEDVVMKALARDRNDRFASAHEMMQAIEQALPREVQAHGERNTEVFLHRLFAKRIAERNAALKSALLAADGAVRPSLDQPVAKQVRSESTMRAVSVGTSDPVPRLPSSQRSSSNHCRRDVERAGSSSWPLQRGSWVRSVPPCFISRRCRWRPRARGSTRAFLWPSERRPIPRSKRKSCRSRWPRRCLRPPRARPSHLLMSTQAVRRRLRRSEHHAVSRARRRQSSQHRQSPNRFPTRPIPSTPSIAANSSSCLAQGRGKRVRISGNSAASGMATRVATFIRCTSSLSQFGA